jgi:hypothetical protein
MNQVERNPLFRCGGEPVPLFFGIRGEVNSDPAAAGLTKQH